MFYCIFITYMFHEFSDLSNITTMSLKFNDALKDTRYWSKKNFHTKPHFHISCLCILYAFPQFMFLHIVCISTGHVSAYHMHFNRSCLYILYAFPHVMFMHFNRSYFWILYAFRQFIFMQIVCIPHVMFMHLTDNIYAYCMHFHRSYFIYKMHIVCIYNFI